VPRRYSAREKILLLAQREVVDRRTGETRPIRSREIAKRLGVSERTVRRWKSGESKPREDNRAKLQRVFRSEAASVRAAQARDHAKHRKSVAPEKLPIVLRGTRRMLKERRIDRKTGRMVETGREVESSWVNYSVRGFNLRELHALLIPLWKAGRVVQLIYEIPRGARYPVGKDGKAPGLTTRKKTRTATEPEALWLMRSEEELLQWLMQYVSPEPGPKSLRPLFLAVDDNKPKRGDT
jgi:transcriptional regulator with XRE-family HTH domain